MLLISRDGKICSSSSFDNEYIQLNNEDLKNCIFDSFILDDNFTFRSFFNMLIEYPVLRMFFPAINSYIDEFKTIDNIDNTSKKIAVIMPVYTVMDQIITHKEDMQIYILDDNDEPISTEEDITTMYLSEYIDYQLDINSLSLLEYFKDDKTRDASYFDNVQEDIFDFLNFVKFIIKNITLHGFVEERNHQIKEIENHAREEKEELEKEAIRITKDIMRKISYGDNK